MSVRGPWVRGSRVSEFKPKSDLNSINAPAQRSRLIRRVYELVFQPLERRTLTPRNRILNSRYFSVVHRPIFIKVLKSGMTFQSRARMKFAFLDLVVLTIAPENRTLSAHPVSLPFQNQFLSPNWCYWVSRLARAPFSPSDVTPISRLNIKSCPFLALSCPSGLLFGPLSVTTVQLLICRRHQTNIKNK